MNSIKAAQVLFVSGHIGDSFMEIHLWNFIAGSVADIAVLRLENGHFGFTDMDNVRVDGTKKLTAEITLKDGKIVYDLNGIAKPAVLPRPTRY